VLLLMCASQLACLLCALCACPQQSASAAFYRADAGKQHAVLEMRHRNFIRRLFAICRGKKPSPRVFSLAALLFCFEDSRSIEAFFDVLVARHPVASR